MEERAEIAAISGGYKIIEESERSLDVRQELEWVVPPRQARSRETLERLLTAAEELLLAGGPERLKVAEVAKRAGSSVWAFYTRFPDKESLLRCIFQRFFEQAVATVDTMLTGERWAHVTTTEIIESVSGFAVAVFREKRELIAALTARVAGNAELALLGQRIGEQIALRLTDLFAARDEKFAHDDPPRAIGFVVWLVLSALNSRALGADATDRDLPDDVIAAELSRMAVAYLGITSTQQ